jgi:hypothetical protein
MFAYTKNLPELGDFDVIVVGSGSAGATASIAAGRAGAKTLLLEKLPFLGGTSTAVLDTFYGFYVPGKTNRKIVGGIPDELVAELGRICPVIERPNTFGAGTGITYHPDALKVAWERLVRAAGCHVLLHAFVQDVVRSGARIDALVVATKAGLQLARTHTVIDASGDADVCALAALPCELAGAEAPAQTLTTTFRMANVDVPRRKTIKKEQLHALMAEAAEKLGYRLPRKEGSDHITPVEHMTATIMTRLSSIAKRDDVLRNATDPALLSSAEMDGREQALEYVRFLRDRVPGYANAQLATFGVQIGVRETRRVHGRYRLTKEDVLSARQFDDQIGLCGAPIEDHHEGADTKWLYLPDGQAVGIPYRTLVPQDADNVLVAGRCFSATHDAHASVRSMGQCMAMGQAAGTAAAQAATGRTPVADIDCSALRTTLRAAGAILA